MRTKLRVVLWSVWIVSVHCADSQHGKLCHDAAIPASKPRGVNQMGNNSTQPLFELNFQSLGQSGAFKVHIVSASQAYVFQDVTIAMTTNGSCGKGNLHFDSGDFTHVEQDESCPTVLVTKRTIPMTSLPSLLWTPPSCGCVQFRVVLALAVENYYYTEAETVSTGPLAKLVCAPDKTATDADAFQLTREQRLDALCHVAERHTSRSILSSIHFKNRHQLDKQYTDRLELEMALELRRSDARMCCSKARRDDKLKCFEDARYRRADRFCQDGFPDLPFVSFRAIFMRSKERRCCSILGAYRYLCFAKDSQLETGNDVTPMDYSQDATDLVNDLAEFATLEDYQQVLAKMFNKSTHKPDGLLDKDTPLDDNIKQEDQTESGKRLSNKQASSHKIIKGEATDPKVVDKKASVTNKERSNDSNNLTETSKLPKPTTSTLPLLRTQAKREEGGLPGSERTPKSSEIYRRQFPTYSKSRRTPQTSAERRKYSRGRNGGRSGMRKSFRRSRERKDRGGKPHNGRRTFIRSSMGRTSISRNTGSTSRRMANSGRRYRGFKSPGKSREVFGENMNVMEDIDNEGGASVEDTLNLLDRKMKRLELRRLCCESGALSGSGVYGSLSVVMTECKHSSQKYLQREEISFGTRKCRKQFVRCCMDEAKMGLTMSSTEFHNKALDGPNAGITQHGDQDHVFLRRHWLRKKEKTVPERFGTARRGATVQEILEAESDRRFESMRAEARDPRFVGEGDEGEGEESEEKTGPTLFDEEDNQRRDVETVFDDVKSKWIPTAKETTAVTHIKGAGRKSRLGDATATEAGVEEKKENVKNDNGGRGKMMKMKEDFDNGKREKDDELSPKIVKEKEGEMVQNKKDSRHGRHFSKSVKIPQSSVKDGQTIRQNISGTEGNSKSQFQNKSKDSYRLNTTQNVAANKQNQSRLNKGTEPDTSEGTRLKVHQPIKQTQTRQSGASRVSQVANSEDNVDKRNALDTKHEQEPVVSEMMHRKARLPATDSHNEGSLGSGRSSVHDKSPNNRRLDLNEERDASLRRQQKPIAPRRQFYGRSRERSRFGFDVEDSFLGTYPTRSRSRMSRRREGGSSRRHFRYNQRRRQREHRLKAREKRVKGHKNKDRQVAMDSQEMADAHDERVKLTSLDSKEMAARYNQGSEATVTFKDKDSLTGRTGGHSKRRRRYRRGFDQ